MLKMFLIILLLAQILNHVYLSSALLVVLPFSLTKTDIFNGVMTVNINKDIGPDYMYISFAIKDVCKFSSIDF